MTDLEKHMPHTARSSNKGKLSGADEKSVHSAIRADSEAEVGPAGIANIGLSCIKWLLSDRLHGKEEDESDSRNEDKNGE